MDWIVFGDDWGAHPSTTQHLVLNLPAEDRVVWVDSLGMRSPKLRAVDLRRLVNKLQGILKPARADNSLYEGSMGSLNRLRPMVAPWHQRRVARAFNLWSLRRSLGELVEQVGLSDPVLLASYPVVVQYLDATEYGKLVYLRLDEYSLYPGVSPEIVEETESKMFRHADAIVATARSLLPSGDVADKAFYLPQGVNCQHYAQVPLAPPESRTLGFFGTVAEWLDFDLIERVARLAPDWQLDFVGQIDCLPEHIAALPNVTFRPAVPFARLPSEIAHWSAAWIPFQINPLTEAVNPLKVREYLAAGLPTHCAPLPEVAELARHVLLTESAEEVADWLLSVIPTDSREAREERRRSVEPDGWTERAEELRRIIRRTSSDFDRLREGVDRQ